MALKTVLTYPKDYYYPEALTSGVLTTEEMRREYARLRRIANDRLSRLGKSKYSTSEIYTQNVDRFIALSDLENERELKYLLYEVTKFVSSKGSSVSGQRDIAKQTLATLRGHGYTFINRTNYDEFGEYMKHARAVLVGKLWDSERAVDSFKNATRLGVSYDDAKQNFIEWYNHTDELARMPRKQNKVYHTSEYYLNRL